MKFTGQPHNDPLWARGFTRLLDIIIENTRRLGLTSTQIRMLLVINLLAFRGQSTSYRRIARLCGTGTSAARRMVRQLAEKGFLELEDKGKVHTISTKPYEDKAVELARTIGPRRQRPPEDVPDIAFKWTVDNLHFTRLPALLLEHPKVHLTATELHLILVISYHTYGFSSYLYQDDMVKTTRARLADLMGVSEETITRTARSLEQKGYAVRATMPGEPLTIDLTPLFNLLRGTETELGEAPAERRYTPEMLREMLSGSLFRDVAPDVINSLIKQYGLDRVALTVDILTQEYAKAKIKNPTRLLRSMVARGITPDEGFIPWVEREKMRREAEYHNKIKEQIAKIKRMVMMRTEQEWAKLSEDERERWRERIRAETAGFPIAINIEEAAKFRFQEEVVFDKIANEHNTPPERREKLRKFLYG